MLLLTVVLVLVFVGPLLLETTRRMRVVRAREERRRRFNRDQDIRLLSEELEL
jgi:hypothetical protein